MRSLQRKVQWDIGYYFACRGAENIYGILKYDFQLITDKDTGVHYIKKVKDEETKNHKETDKDIVTGFMPEIKGSKFCPVTSYLMYVNALSYKSEKLWQTPSRPMEQKNGIKALWVTTRLIPSSLKFVRSLR